MKAAIHGHLEEAYVKSKTTSYQAEDWMTHEWTSIMNVDQNKQVMSGIPVA